MSLPATIGKPNPRLMAFALRFVALIAVLLMPFGMSAAPAADHHQAMAGTSMPHCPEQQPSPQSKGFLGECTMACSAALPAADVAPMSSRPVARPSFEPRLAPALSSIELEIATPPPRLS